MNKHQGILFDNKRISWLIVANLGCAFLIFMGGYFLGKKSVLEKFSHANAFVQKASQEDRLHGMRIVSC